MNGSERPKPEFEFRPKAEISANNLAEISAETEISAEILLSAETRALWTIITPISVILRTYMLIFFCQKHPQCR